MHIPIIYIPKKTSTNYVLLKFDNSFTESGSGLSINNNGVFFTSLNPPSGMNYSAFFNGSDYLTVGNTSNWNFGLSEDFTVEAYVYLNNGSINRTICGTHISPYNGTFMLLIYYENGNNYLTAVINGNYYAIISSIFPLNTWCHVALSKSGDTFRIFLNGILGRIITSDSGLTATTGKILTIGRNLDFGGLWYWSGMISNFRFSRNCCLYTANFTPPTLPF